MSLLGSVIQGIQSAENMKKIQEEIDNLPEYRDLEATSELSSYYNRLSDLSDDPYSESSNKAFAANQRERANAANQRAASVDPSVSGGIMSALNTSGMNSSAQRDMRGDDLRSHYVGQLGQATNMFQELQNWNDKDYNRKLENTANQLVNSQAQQRERAENAWVHFGDESERKVGKIMTSIFGGGMGGATGGVGGGDGGGGGDFSGSTYKTPSYSPSAGGGGMASNDYGSAWGGGDFQGNYG